MMLVLIQINNDIYKTSIFCGNILQVCECIVPTKTMNIKIEILLQYPEHK